MSPSEWLFSLYLVFLCHQEATEPQRTSIYRSLVVNTSKEIMCFSDFPMPDDFPNYMLHSQLLQYLSLYAEHFHLLRYINFQVVEHTKSVTDLSHKQTYVTSKIVTCFTVHTNDSDQGEECYTKTRFLSVWSVGRSDHKQGWRGRKARLWCCPGVFRS